MGLFEPEELVGKYWHRLVGRIHTYPPHPEAAVPFDAVRARLGVVFRGLGGNGAIRIVSGAPSESGHRLKLRQRLGAGREKMERALLDAEALRFPAVADVFPSRQDNEALYEWLAAWFANAPPAPEKAADPLQADILQLRHAIETAQRTVSRWPGLAEVYSRLSSASLNIRPVRRLPKWEAAIEAVIQTFLGGEAANPLLDDLLAAIGGRLHDLSAFHAPPGYQTFLLPPLWGEILLQNAGVRADDPDDNSPGSGDADPHRRRAVRRPSDRSERGDPLLLSRFDAILSVAEMVNVNRQVEDDDEQSARQAADDLSEITIGSNKKRPATRLKLDLDLASEEAPADPGDAELTYPEWDWKRQAYHPNYCRIVPGLAPDTGEEWKPSEQMRIFIRQVRRQFEALHPNRRTFYGQPDGEDLDISALVRDLADRRAGLAGAERLFVCSRLAERDLSLAVLIDASQSTNSWLQGCRVMDVEKSALMAFTHGVSACGDEHAIYAFTSRRRNWVRIMTVKGFEERLDTRVLRRIQALKPGQYTRMGAAIRHVAAQLKERPHRKRLLLVLTDGKPNDIDHYEGRYGIEDTRVAIREARMLGIRVFGVTVDEHARDYFPYIFGRGAYAICPNVTRLPMALPAIYRQITR